MISPIVTLAEEAFAKLIQLLLEVKPPEELKKAIDAQAVARAERLADVAEAAKFGGEA